MNVKKQLGISRSRDLYYTMQVLLLLKENSLVLCNVNKVCKKPCCFHVPGDTVDVRSGKVKDGALLIGESAIVFPWEGRIVG